MEEILITHGSIGFHETQCVNFMEDIGKGESDGQTLNVTLVLAIVHHLEIATARLIQLDIVRDILHIYTIVFVFYNITDMLPKQKYAHGHHRNNIGIPQGQQFFPDVFYFRLSVTYHKHVD
jgi:hypothetical protein